MILHGHILDAIKQIPDGSVHCVVTSPPYWGLRNYGTDPQIWPDGLPQCEAHEWSTTPPRRKRKSTDVINVESKQATNAGAQHYLPTSDFCRRCNAWRGELGLEPIPELYVKHMLEIFREVRRVLRDDGTLWLNLGDSYWAGKGQSAHADPERHVKRLAEGKTINRPYQEIGRPGWTAPKDGKHEIIKPKDLVGIPWMVAFALRADGWWLRSDIIWHKPNHMPESVTDRPTKSHEYIFLLSKTDRYYYDAIAIMETGSNNSHGGGNPNAQHKRKVSIANGGGGHHSGLVVAKPAGHNGRNKRDVWTITTEPFKGAHFATFPTDIPEICIKAGTSQKGCCPKCGAPWERIIGKGLTAHDGSSNTQYPKTLGWKPTCDCGEEAVIPCTVLDPFGGSGTTAEVAKRLGRDFILIELKKEYITELIEPRIGAINPLFAEKP
jgi:DNA modification methylase